MSKNHRGRPLRKEVPRGGRGTCPVSKRRGVKLLYEYEIEGEKVMISKAAKAMLENKRHREERAAKRAEMQANNRADTTSRQKKQNKETSAAANHSHMQESTVTESENSVASHPSPADEHAPAAKVASSKVADSVATTAEPVQAPSPAAQESQQ